MIRVYCRGRMGVQTLGHPHSFTSFLKFIGFGKVIINIYYSCECVSKKLFNLFQVL
uniref:Uncharacterized protein n=1 Tax=Anguilla anguilla TaxID=7936 RepID=A0A0E9Q9A7_ANGAN